MNDALAAVDAAAVAVLAYRGRDGAPLAVPVTPYLDGPSVVITSTIAFIRKAELIRRDDRVGLLAHGVHMRGRARVTADPSGDFFVGRYLEQELRKFPPARALVQVPDYQRVLSSYFGRAIITFEPEDATQRAGDDSGTVVSVTDDGFPSITAVGEIDADATTMGVEEEHHDGPACVLVHREGPEMSTLRWVRLAGHIGGGVFHVERRTGSLTEDWAAVDYAAREARAREIMKGWEQA